MGKKALPTAENSGMTKNSILKYVFVKKKSTTIPGIKVDPALRTALQEQRNNREDDTSDSSCASTSFSAPIPLACSTHLSENLQDIDSNEDESEASLPRLKINPTIFEESDGSQSQPDSQGASSRVDVNGNERKLAGGNQVKVEHHQATRTSDSDNDNTSTSDESEDEFSIPRIIHVQSLQKECKVRTSVIQYGARANADAENVDNARSSTEEVTIEAFKFDPAELRLHQRRNHEEEHDQVIGGKKRRDSAGSSSSSSTGSEKSKSDKDKALDALIEKKRWEIAIPQLIANLENDTYPSFLVMALVLNDCILKSRRTSAKANEMMEKIQSKAVGKPVESFEFILQAIRSVSAVLDEHDKNQNNCYWPMVNDLIQTLILNAKTNCALDGKHVLRFLNTFVGLLEDLYESYMSSTKAQWHLPMAPMVVRIFEGDPSEQSPPPAELRLGNLKANISQLTKSLFDVQYFDAESDVLARLFQLLVRHYYGPLRRTKNFKKALIDQFSSVLAGSKNYGIRILSKVQDANFGQHAALEVIEKQLQELRSYSLADKCTFMTCLARSRVIRRHHMEKSQYIAPSTCRVTRGTNKAGESLLHRVCGDPKKHEKLDLTLNEVLDEIEASSTATVNVPDNGNNFPLHDAANNGRVDQLKILLERCGAGQTNDRLRINPLLRNNNGDTAIHLAVKKGNLDVVKLIVDVIGERGKVELNLDMANYSGITPMNSSNNVQIKEYLRSLQPEAAPWEDNFYFPESKVRLSPESVAKLKTDSFLQQVVVLFNNFIAQSNSSS